MTGPALKLRATSPNGSAADIETMCRTITWSGDWRSAARTLRYTPVVCQDDAHLPRAPTELGGLVQFWAGGTLLMDAFALERTRDSLGRTIDVTAYDRGLYLTRNSAFLRVEGQTAEAVTASLCRQFGIKTGALAATGIPITRNFLGVPLYKIVMTMYSLAADQTEKKYHVRFRGSALEVAEAAQPPESVVLRPGSNLLGCVTKESASAVTNSVAIYNDRCELVSTRQDDEAIALYGLMQAAIRSGAYDDPEGHAKKLLKESGLKTTITITTLGDTRLITGSTVMVEEPVTGTRGLFWIISDAHTWARGLYQTKLTLSLEAVMDSQTAGSAAKT